MSISDVPEDPLNVPEGFFKDVKFYLIGDVDDKV